MGVTSGPRQENTPKPSPTPSMKQSEEYFLRLRSAGLWSSRAISVSPFAPVAPVRTGNVLVGRNFIAPVFQAPRPFVPANFSPTASSILSGVKSA